MARGTISMLARDEGYWFLHAEEGELLLFQRSQLRGADYSSLIEGQEVEFETATNRGALPAAINVKLASPSDATASEN